MVLSCIETAASIAFAGMTSRFDHVAYPEVLKSLRACTNATLNQQPLPETEHTPLYRGVILSAFGKIDEGRHIVDGVKALRRLAGG